MYQFFISYPLSFIFMTPKLLSQIPLSEPLDLKKEHLQLFLDFPKSNNLVIFSGESGVGKLQYVYKLSRACGFELMLMDFQFLQGEEDGLQSGEENPLAKSLLKSVSPQKIIYVLRNLYQIDHFFSSSKVPKMPVVLLLNSSIYFETHLRKKLPAALIVRVPNYSPAKLKKLFPRYDSKILFEQSGGDYNKASSSIQFPRKSTCEFFHLCGKFLYNKRLDALSKTQRKMTHQELLLRPPFYFNVLELLQGHPSLQNIIPVMMNNGYRFYEDLRDLGQLYQVFTEADVLDRAFFRERSQALRDFHELALVFLVVQAVMIKNTYPHPKIANPVLNFPNHKELARQSELNRYFCRRHAPTLKSYEAAIYTKVSNIRRLPRVQHFSRESASAPDERYLVRSRKILQQMMMVDSDSIEDE